ncbi:hypothetical protein Tco_0008578 [Tanacetum coccineum]
MKKVESSLAKPNTDDDMNIKLGNEFLMELQSNAYYRMFDEDVVDHIAKVLEMLDLIKIPNVDSHRLHMKVFPLSLVDDARQWWIDEGDGKITTWKELVEKFFCKFHPLSRMAKSKILEEGKNWGLDPPGIHIQNGIQYSKNIEEVEMNTQKHYCILDTEN